MVNDRMGRDAYDDQTDERMSATANTRWFYKMAAKADSGVADTGGKDGPKSGPVDRDTLRGLLADNALAPDTKVWREGLSSWMSATDVEELADAVAAGRAASLQSTTGGTPWLRRAATCLCGTLAVTLLAWSLFSVFRSSGAPVIGVVMANGQPVSGGTVVFAPLAESKGDRPGKPAVANVGRDGGYSLLLTRGERGLAKRCRVCYSPPVLPPMDEEEAMKAVPPYVGLVPEQPEVDISARANQIDINLVPAGSR